MVIMDRQDYISKANTYSTKTYIGLSPRTLPILLKTSLLVYLKGLKVKQGLAIKPTRQCIPQVVSLQVLWPSQNPQAGHSVQAYCVQLWVCHIWGGKGTCQNLKTISWQVPPPHKQYPRLCEAGQTHHPSTRGMPQLI